MRTNSKGRRHANIKVPNMENKMVDEQNFAQR
jgi:hypothetical protein